jgi:hypothetical protein
LEPAESFNKSNVQVTLDGAAMGPKGHTTNGQLDAMCHGAGDALMGDVMYLEYLLGMVRGLAQID